MKDVIVKFFDEGHKYIDNRGLRYISVTQAIHVFVPEFDEIYWSKFKAREWNQLEEGDKRWNHQEVLQIWKQMNIDACTRGSQIHDLNERFIINPRDPKVWLLANEEQKKYLTYLLRQQYHQKYDDVTAEHTVFNKNTLLAGRMDLRLRKGREVLIDDYKTNKEIAKEGFRKETLLHPFKHLQNCNFDIYRLQLSIYAVLDMEMYGTKVVRLRILHMLNGEVVEHEFPILYDEAKYIITYAREIKAFADKLAVHQHKNETLFEKI